jgi:hypothetical protein
MDSGAVGRDEIERAASKVGRYLLEKESPLSIVLMSTVDEAIERKDADAIEKSFEHLARYVGVELACVAVLTRYYAANLREVIPLEQVDSGLEIVDCAFSRLRELASKRLDGANEAERREWQWVDAAVLRALSRGAEIDREVMLGLTEAFHAKLIERRTLEKLRDVIGLKEAARIADCTRSSEARAILLNRPLVRMQLRMELKRMGERAVAARVSRGPTAPRCERFEK